MLKFLRKKTKAVIWTVLVSFIAWGGYAVSVQFDKTNRSAGRIFGKEISFREYQQANQTVVIFSPKPNDKQNLPRPEEIDAQVWQFLILSREAKRHRIPVSDEEVRGAILQLFAGKEATELPRDPYLAWVRTALHEEPAEFENQVREHLRVQKLILEIQKEKGETSEEGFKRWFGELLTRSRLQIYSRRS